MKVLCFLINQDLIELLFPACTSVGISGFAGGGSATQREGDKAGERGEKNLLALETNLPGDPAAAA